MKGLTTLVILIYASLTITYSQDVPVHPRNQNNETNTENWQQLDSKEGQFWAFLPSGEVTFSSTPISTAYGSIMLNMYVLDKGDMAYFISYSDYPENIKKSSSTQQLLENANNGALGNLGSKNVLSKNNVTINSFPAIMSHVKGNLNEMQVTFKGFQLIAENRLYQVYILSTGILDEILADKFINSFIVNKTGWTAKFGDNNSFKFSMPGNSTFTSQPTLTAVGTVDFNMYLLDRGNVAWFATYTDFPENHIKRNNPIDLLNSSYNGVITKISDRKEIKKDFYKLSGYDALKADLEGIMEINGQPYNVHYRGILALVNNRLYQIYSLAVGTGYNEQDANYFEESFKLIKD